MPDRLTPAQLAAGRAWRDQCQAALSALNSAQPPDESRPPFVRHIRHLCPENQNRSVSFDYAEIYVPGPEMVVYSADGKPAGIAFVDDGAGQAWRTPLGHTKDVVPAGRFAFIYHEGRCADCGRAARSTTGRAVDGHARQPVGRVVPKIA